MRYLNYKYNRRATKLLQIITESPGLTFTDIMRQSGFANGVLSHYLVNMERHSMIRASRNKKKKAWYFLPDDPVSDDSLIISLRKETCKTILVFLLTKKQATFKEILEQTKKSPSTISLTLSQLANLGLIKKFPRFVKEFEIHNREHVIDVLQKIEPTTFDVMKDRFADTFSYF
ncbi:MAG: ArsR family transcriptional regulator [Thaumarchaeota archaeon]|nr:ArsR family transcriptional regulator [Nitrososphaerota archaeon]